MEKNQIGRGGGVGSGRSFVIIKPPKPGLAFGFRDLGFGIWDFGIWDLVWLWPGCGN